VQQLPGTVGHFLEKVGQFPETVTHFLEKVLQEMGPQKVGLYPEKVSLFLENVLLFLEVVQLFAGSDLQFAEVVAHIVRYGLVD
jgi:hypothetical protein